MAVKTTSKAADGTSFEWKLERGGRLFVREAGTQRWAQAHGAPKEIQQWVEAFKEDRR